MSKWTTWQRQEQREVAGTHLSVYFVCQDEACCKKERERAEVLVGTVQYG